MRITLGAGVGIVPKYPGAEDYRLRAVPVLGVSYGRFFAGGDAGAEGAGLGVNLVRDPNWRLGTARLVGDAEESPITRERTQNLAAVFASYRF